MQKILSAIFTLLIFASPALAKHKHLESWYVDRWCYDLTGDYDHDEIRVNYEGSYIGRVDCLSHSYAIEVDFATKSYECIGQALAYAAFTGKCPGCLLIIETDKDLKHIKKVEAVNKHILKHPIRLWIIDNRDGMYGVTPIE